MTHLRVHVLLLGIAVASFVVAAAFLLAGLPWFAIFPAGEGLVVLLVALRLRRRALGLDLHDAGRPGPAPPLRTTLDLDQVDLSGVPEPVEACPHCGYLGIRAPAVSDGAIPGAAELSDLRVCRRCGYRGLATVFGTRDEYRAFLKGLAAASGG